MRKTYQLLAGFAITCLVTLSGVANMECRAADTYTVTFRAGNVGTFQTDSLTSTNDVSVTDNYIKFKVPKGTKISDTIQSSHGQTKSEADLDYFFRQITDIKSGYLLLNESEWGPSVTDTVDRNKEYVLDYGKLGDSVQYRISYVDSKSGTSIAKDLISYGNAGDVVEASPITVDGYTTQNKAKSMTLTRSGENKLSFNYQSTTKSKTTIDTVTKEIPGQTIANTQTRVIYTENVVNVPNDRSKSNHNATNGTTTNSNRNMNNANAANHGNDQNAANASDRANNANNTTDTKKGNDNNKSKTEDEDGGINDVLADDKSEVEIENQGVPLSDKSKEDATEKAAGQDSQTSNNIWKFLVPGIAFGAALLIVVLVVVIRGLSGKLHRGKKDDNLDL